MHGYVVRSISSIQSCRTFLPLYPFSCTNVIICVDGQAGLLWNQNFPKRLYIHRDHSVGTFWKRRLPIAVKSFLCFAKGTYWCVLCMIQCCMTDFFLPIVEIVRSSGGRPAKNLGNQAGTWLVVCVEQNGPCQTVGALWSLTWPLQASWRLFFSSLNISELNSYLNWLSYFTNVATGWPTVTSSEKEIVGTSGFPFQTKPFTQISSLQSYMDLNQPGATFSWQSYKRADKFCTFPIKSRQKLKLAGPFISYLGNTWKINLHREPLSGRFNLI